jgi:hypothetical protein
LGRPKRVKDWSALVITSSSELALSLHACLSKLPKLAPIAYFSFETRFQPHSLGIAYLSFETRTSTVSATIPCNNDFLNLLKCIIMSF